MEAGEGRRRGGLGSISFGALEHRDFRLLWTGWTFHSVASWIHIVVTGWLIYELTDSAFMLGLSGVFMSVPFLVTSLFGGGLADRMDRRRLLIITQGILAGLSFVPAVLTAADLIQVWHLYALSLVSWTTGAFDAPARHALIPTLVPRHQLMQAITLTSSVRYAAALVGPMIGGLAIAGLGVTGTFVVYALLNTCMLVTIVLMRPRAVELEPRGTSMAQTVLDGIRFVRGQPLIYGILTLEATNSIFGTYIVLLPVFARDILHVGPAGLGLLYTAPGVGALLGSALLLRMGDVSKKGRLFMASAVAKPLTVALFAISPWMATSLAMLVLAGVLEVIGGTVRNTMLQLLTADRMRGRVMSMNMMVNKGLGPISGVQSGAVASLVSAPVALLAGAAIVVGYVVWITRRIPGLAAYEDRGAPSEERAERLARV